ncbi:MAG: UDP-N-acetylmuramoyl-L-alanine--D-glutamate ligase [Candidatus Omnitrophica bacterium]|nr:UDP-N-acetylmuramoyl-L-alanine--D-glutamate ligase [Candidatus Omnitrophota bacterium]
MRNTGYFKNKKVTVVGLARSGMCVARLLSGLGAEVWVTESGDNEINRANAAESVSRGLRIELGKHSAEFIQGRDLVVLSPGVPLDAPPVRWARDAQVPVISEIEAGWILCPAPVIAVTGANGKTTVTTLIGEVLAASGRNVFVCGNIGNPFCGEVERIGPHDFVVLEVSSFQLETIERFRPAISVILNLTPNHLDRYKDMDEYIAAKKRIFMNQDEGDYLVLNGDDAVLRDAARETGAQVRFFGIDKGYNPNQSAVMAVGSILGIERNICEGVFRCFKGIEHRMEQVAEIRGVFFINDSKATTADSAVWALKDLHGPIIWIAGGRHKGIDYRVVLRHARGKVKQVIVIGEAGCLIRDVLGTEFPVNEAATLEDAVAVAFGKALPGDCVLLSPMCSSYDMFRDYEERGRVFKKAVLELQKRETSSV